MTAPIESVLDAADARFEAILCAGLGRDGALGADAEACAIAAQTFRRVDSPLTDTGLADELFDRGAYLAWLSTESDPRNTRDPHYELAARLELSVGYVAGRAQQAVDLKHLAPGSDEAAAVRAKRPQLAALGDARRIALAFELPALHRDESAAHVVIDVVREGPATVSAAAPTRWVLSQTFLVRLWATNTPTPATP